MAMWQKLHTEDVSWRKALVGNISDYYTIPKYLKLFNEYFGKEKDLELLEIGAGNGDLSKKLSQSNSRVICRYVATEHYEQGVKVLSSLGLDACLVNAERIDLQDKSFDIVCSFDVMHHVSDPFKMAREITRVSRKYVFLTEANGLSLGRKLFEKRHLYQEAGERSYLPKSYKAFFDQSQFKAFTIKPFLFVFKTPNSFVKPMACFSEIMEKVPVLRWQCATLVIFGEKY